MIWRFWHNKCTVFLFSHNSTIEHVVHQIHGSLVWSTPQRYCRFWRGVSNLEVRYTPTTGERTTILNATFLIMSPIITLLSTVKNFVDPATGVHTQEAQSAWANLKLPIKGRRGMKCHDLQLYLNDRMWRHWRGLDNIANVLPVLASQYRDYSVWLGQSNLNIVKFST